MNILNPKEWILEHQEELFEFYLGVPVSTKLVMAPFREETKPSCGFYYSKSGRLYLHDFGNDEYYDIFEIVKRKYDYSYYRALNKIMSDAHLIELKDKPNLNKNEEVTYVLNNTYGDYFNSFHIKLATLKRFNVAPVKAVYIDHNLYWRATEKNPIFAYRFPSGNYKLYRPLSDDATKKWKNVCSQTDIQGYHQLPPKGSIVLITSSLKDAMVLYELGYPAIAFNSEQLPTRGESVKFIKDMVDQLKERFDFVITFMDNDGPGKEAASRIEKTYKLAPIHIPDNKPKDISDYIKKYGRNRTTRLMKKLISKRLSHAKTDIDYDYLGFVDGVGSTYGIPATNPTGNKEN